MLHVWWECPPVKKFWKQIFDLYGKLEGIVICASPRVALLNMTQCSLKKAREEVLGHFISAARVVIPRYWKTRLVPSLGEWAKELERSRDLESLLARETGREEQFFHTWTAWSEFRKSDEFSNWVKGNHIDE